MDSLLKLIARTLVRGEVYRLIRRSKGVTSAVAAIAAGAVLVVLQAHR